MGQKVGLHNDQIVQADLGKHFLAISHRKPCTDVSTQFPAPRKFLQPPNCHAFHVHHLHVTFGIYSFLC